MGNMLAKAITQIKCTHLYDDKKNQTFKSRIINIMVKSVDLAV